MDNIYELIAKLLGLDYSRGEDFILSSAYTALNEQQAEIERLLAVVDAVKDIKWRSIEKDNMEFATTCFVVDRIRKALAALKEADDE